MRRFRALFLWGLGFLICFGVFFSHQIREYAQANVNFVQEAAPIESLAVVSSPNDSLKTPPSQQVQVSILFFVYDFGEINQVLQKYNLNAVIGLQWQDPRLGFTPGSENEVRTVPLAQIWWPALEVANAINFELKSDENVRVLPDGTVVYLERINPTLSSELNLQRFPFDRQELKFVIESEVYSAEELVLNVRDKPSQWRQEAFLSEWNLEKITQRVVTTQLVSDADEFSQARFAIQIRRRAGFYIWKGFLPLFLITVVAWLSLWVPLLNVPTGPLPLSIGALLTATTFIFTIAGTLPRISYLTFFDAFFLACYISIFITLAVNVYLTAQLSPTAQKHEEVRVWARKLVPGSFGLSVLIISLIFFL